jgi:hypothetical protein
MRCVLLLPLLFNVLYAVAQCCCSDIMLLVTLEHGAIEGDHDMTYDNYQVSSYDRDSTDGTLHFRMDAGCGITERTLTITRRYAKEQMVLHVLFTGFDGVHPSLRVPFLPGEYEVDFDRLRDCSGADHFERLTPSDTTTVTRSTIPCGACNVLVQQDRYGVALEPMDLAHGGCGPGHVEVDAPGLAYCHGGQIAFQAGVKEELNKRLSLRPNGSVLYSGIARVSERGQFHGRMKEEQTDLVYELELALMRGPDWSPAWVYDVQSPDGKRPVNSVVRFKLIKAPEYPR